MISEHLILMFSPKKNNTLTRWFNVLRITFGIMNPQISKIRVRNKVSANNQAR